MSSSLVVRYQEQRYYTDTARDYRDEQQLNALRISFSELQNIVKASLSMQKAVEKLLEAPSDSDFGQDHVQAAFSTLNQATTKIVPLVQNLWTQVPAHNIPSNRSASKAEEVFNTTELLEQILLYLRPADLLRAQQVNTTFYDTINESLPLAEILGLAADDGSFFYSPFLQDHDGSNRFPGIKAYVRDNWSPHDHSASDGLCTVTNDYEIELQLELDKLWDIGGRCAAMLICSPPVTCFNVEMWQKGTQNYRKVVGGVYTVLLGTPTGLGDVVRNVCQFLVDKELVPWAQSIDHRTVGVAVIARPTLRDDDPIVLKRHEERRALEERLEKRRAEAEDRALANAKAQAEREEMVDRAADGATDV
ncbi:hypothetical protein CLAFUW4_05462 [Fulvia fulva]|uniref:F-box domain-containing protein n=1 Tax=Passalora fulva TaxID=5499 RepID=A0A9Q8LHG5_PASFU|nr:uncharacterized protein CLAFUR5_05605 [Fulvia fulva]KAK4624751.1 hypothetical protein CLAFUR4_05456 [Fulvia fulva]KAK4625148.1 hypothetical protein CLAFUR0_05464 [Fulvia fulva]UJO17512.1 hypothetical protein CLAFUR5_05605 [Fulvia fulva]WPV14554.1 hypothetical protein CLAFUW4_05462 [Fulvia fulva]WPV30591.1 hypothetical protein CLAFUW7_05460 [Fulvia fulva]